MTVLRAIFLSTGLALLAGCSVRSQATLQTESPDLKRTVALTSIPGDRESGVLTEPSQAHQATPAAVEADDPSEDVPTLEERWGIRIVEIRCTAAGYMLDFRYKVLDPEKAAAVANRKDKPCLIDEASGRRFLVPSPPKVGALRQTARELRPGGVYFILFANPGRFVQPGSKVTVLIGDFEVKHLTVQ